MLDGGLEHLKRTRVGQEACRARLSHQQFFGLARAAACNGQDSDGVPVPREFGDETRSGLRTLRNLDDDRTGLCEHHDFDRRGCTPSVDQPPLMLQQRTSNPGFDLVFVTEHDDL